MPEIRKAIPADIDSIIHLWKGLMDMHAPFNPLFQTVPDFADKIRPEIEKWLENEAYTFFVAAEENEIAGFIKINVIERPLIFVQSKYGHIGETFVSEKFRGKGIGKDLTDAAKAHFRSHKVDFIDLVVSENNPNGVTFWKAQGFETVNHLLVQQL